MARLEVDLADYLEIRADGRRADPAVEMAVFGSASGEASRRNGAHKDYSMRTGHAYVSRNKSESLVPEDYVTSAPGCESRKIAVFHGRVDEMVPKSLNGDGTSLPAKANP